MEVVKTTTIGTRKRAPKTRIDKSAALLSLISRVLKNMYKPARMQELIEDLSPRDRAMFICHFIRPPQPERPKDQIEQLNSKQVDELYERILNHAK